MSLGEEEGLLIWEHVTSINNMLETPFFCLQHEKQMTTPKASYAKEQSLTFQAYGLQ